MPEHIKFILRQVAVGFGLAVAFVGLLLAFNVVGLWHLVTHTADGPMALLMLVAFFTITFGSAQIGYKIMTMGSDGNDDIGRHDRVEVRDAVPVPVRRDEPPHLRARRR